MIRSGQSHLSLTLSVVTSRRRPALSIALLLAPGTMSGAESLGFRARFLPVNGWQVFGKNIVARDGIRRDGQLAVKQGPTKRLTCLNGNVLVLLENAAILLHDTGITAISIDGIVCCEVIWGNHGPNTCVESFPW